MGLRDYRVGRRDRVLRVAIVGASQRRWTNSAEVKRARKFIKDLLRTYKLVYKDGLVVISGGCLYGGVDIWAVEIARELGIRTLVYPPRGHSWEHFKERNIKIAESCDVLYCIEPRTNPSRGGRWTLEYARKLGKTVYLIRI